MIVIFFFKKNLNFPEDRVIQRNVSLKVSVPTFDAVVVSRKLVK